MDGTEQSLLGRVALAAVDPFPSNRRLGDYLLSCFSSRQSVAQLVRVGSPRLDAEAFGKLVRAHLLDVLG
jgi:hypothetical protein